MGRLPSNQLHPTRPCVDIDPALAASNSAHGHVVVVALYLDREIDVEVLLGALDLEPRAEIAGRFQSDRTGARVDHQRIDVLRETEPDRSAPGVDGKPARRSSVEIDLPRSAVGAHVRDLDFGAYDRAGPGVDRDPVRPDTPQFDVARACFHRNVPVHLTDQDISGSGLRRDRTLGPAHADRSRSDLNRQRPREPLHLKRRAGALEGHVPLDVRNPGAPDSQMKVDTLAVGHEDLDVRVGVEPGTPPRDVDPAPAVSQIGVGADSVRRAEAVFAVDDPTIRIDHAQRGQALDRGLLNGKATAIASAGEDLDPDRGPGALEHSHPPGDVVDGHFRAFEQVTAVRRAAHPLSQAGRGAGKNEGGAPQRQDVVKNRLMA